MTHEDYIRQAEAIASNRLSNVKLDHKLAFPMIQHLVAEIKDMRNLLLLNEVRLKNLQFDKQPTLETALEYRDLVTNLETSTSAQAIRRRVREEADQLERKYLDGKSRDGIDEEMRWRPRDKE